MRKQKEVKPMPYSGYTDCNIPAKLFFKVASSGQYELLGAGEPRDCEDAFYTIFDEYFKLDPNETLRDIYKKAAKIRGLQLRISFIETCLHQIIFVPMTVEERLLVIDVLNGLDGVRINFSKDKPIKEEVSRVQSRIIGALKNEIKHETITEKKQKAGIERSFEQDLASICINLGIYLHNEITLYEYIAYRKLAIERSEANKKQNQAK